MRRSRHEAQATDALCLGFDDFSFETLSVVLFCSSCPSNEAAFCWSFALAIACLDSVVIPFVLSSGNDDKLWMEIIVQPGGIHDSRIEARKCGGKKRIQQHTASIRTKMFSGFA
jgi:hypothetical protein